MQLLLLSGLIVMMQIPALSGCRGSDPASVVSSIVAGDIIPTVYPSDTVRNIKELGIKEGDYIRKNRGSFTYKGNSGHEEPSLVISPYYTLSIDGQEIPVYSTIVYVGTDGECALQSFSIIELRDTIDVDIDVALTAQRYPLENAVVLPESRNVEPVIDGDIVRASISDYGNYSFLMNDEDNEVSQYNAFTLFVREYVDEDEEIAGLKAEYGEANVTIYESGTHLFDYINIENDNTVVYLRRGALLVTNGNPEYGEKNQYTEPGAKYSNGWGLERFPVITANGRKNIRITGGGAIDAGQLGWHERKGIMITFCTDVEISGITLMNFPDWTITTYCSSEIDIHDVAIFGYKTNSDGFAICNSKNAVIRDCFARSGDDLFEVKTLGGSYDATSENVRFQDCVAWASKARAFGVIAEVTKNISDIVFKDCAVIIQIGRAHV